MANTFLTSTQSNVMLTIHIDVFPVKLIVLKWCISDLLQNKINQTKQSKNPNTSFPAFPGHAVPVRQQSTICFLQPATEAGDGKDWYIGHPSLPCFLRDISKEKVVSLLTWITYLAYLTQLSYLLFPKGAKSREGDAGRRHTHCELPHCPAVSQEGRLGGDRHQKRQRSETRVVKFDGSRSSNCSTSHTCHTGSSLATGKKKYSLKKLLLLSSASPAAQAGCVALNPGATLAAELLSALV